MSASSDNDISHTYFFHCGTEMRTEEFWETEILAVFFLHPVIINISFCQTHLLSGSSESLTDRHTWTLLEKTHHALPVLSVSASYDTHTKHTSLSPSIHVICLQNQKPISALSNQGDDRDPFSTSKVHPLKTSPNINN